MICDNCKKHIERKFLSKGKTVNCLNYACERPYRNKGLIECTRDEICDYIHEILQPERSKREDLIKSKDAREDFVKHDYLLEVPKAF